MPTVSTPGTRAPIRGLLGTTWAVPLDTSMTDPPSCPSDSCVRASRDASHGNPRPQQVQCPLPTALSLGGGRAAPYAGTVPRGVAAGVLPVVPSGSLAQNCLFLGRSKQLLPKVSEQLPSQLILCCGRGTPHTLWFWRLRGWSLVGAFRLCHHPSEGGRAKGG